VHTLQQLQQMLRDEVDHARAANIKFLTLAGEIITLQAKMQIGQYQSHWPPNTMGEPQGKLLASTLKRKFSRSLSAPGGMDADAPLYETGAYKDSIEFRVLPLVKTVEVGSDLPYAKDLEYGTSRQSPRPIFKEALLRSYPLLVKILNESYLKQISKG
jgi:hypothetical protein